MPKPTAKEEHDPSYIAYLALESLARYAGSGLVRKGERLHEELAARLVRVVAEDSWAT